MHSLTIQDAINRIIADVPGSPFQDTVDVVKVGDASQPITGIVTTFLASVDVIEKAIQLNANLIITHEPIFYNHLDQTDWLRDSPVYQAKRRLIEDNHLVVWRFHDYMHSLRPDPVMVGILKMLGWEAYFEPERFVCNIPPITLDALVAYVKNKLGIQTLRMIGDLDMTCRTVALVPGFPPPQWQFGSFSLPEVDVLIAGEIHEWEASEFTRDAIHLQHKKALIVMGHAASEEPGMRGIVPWIQERLPEIPIQFIPTENIFQYV